MQAEFIQYIFLILLILCLVMLSQKLRIAYPIVLVTGGLALGFLPGMKPVEINPEYIFVIFLPPLLYEAAWYTSWKEFWRWRRVIFSFAFLIVIVTSFVVAVAANAIIPGFSLALGFLLGGIVSPPDAVSATSIIRNVKVKVPKRLVAIMEGESLLNDASSLIVFRFAMIAVSTGVFVFQQAATQFVVVIVMGTLVGLAVALLYYAIHRWLPTTPHINIVLTFTAPYLMYLTAERFHFSGVLATVSGGLFLSYRKHTILDHSSRLQGANVWGTIGFVLNGLIFLLIGLELPLLVQRLDVPLGEAIRYALLISLLLMVTRVLCTLGASVFTVAASKVITTADNRPGWKGPLVFGWAGMRGVVSLAAALSIPVYMADGREFPHRDLILFITFIVILVTLIFQGLTLPLLIKWVNLPDRDFTMSHEEQDRMVRSRLSSVALELLNDKFTTEVAGNVLLRANKRRLESELLLLSDQLEGDGAFENFRSISRELMHRQRQLLHDLNKSLDIDEAVIRKYEGMLDLEEERLSLIFSKGHH